LKTEVFEIKNSNEEKYKSLKQLKTSFYSLGDYESIVNL